MTFNELIEKGNGYKVYKDGNLYYIVTNTGLFTYKSMNEVNDVLEDNGMK